MSNTKFNGFEPPKTNWSKLPHSLIEALPLIETKAEMSVILYILRHTWGYQEYDGTPKKITLDEFENGRKHKDGSRIDNGVGMSRPSIIDGLTRAQEHGFIQVEVDESDTARVKKFYAVNMQGSKNFTPDVKELDTSGKETVHRSEKDTSRKKPKKEKKADASQPQLPNTPVPLHKHPAVVIYKGFRKRFCDKPQYPNKGQMKQIAKDIGNSDSQLEKWRQVLWAWGMQGNNPLNVTGQLDWFKDGIPDYAQTAEQRNKERKEERTRENQELIENSRRVFANDPYAADFMRRLAHERGRIPQSA